MESQICVRIPHQLREQLERAAQRSGLKPSDLVRAALRSYLGEKEEAARPIDRVHDLIGAYEGGGRSETAEEARRRIVERIVRHASRPS